MNWEIKLPFDSIFQEHFAKNCQWIFVEEKASDVSVAFLCHSVEALWFWVVDRASDVATIWCCTNMFIIITNNSRPVKNVETTRAPGTRKCDTHAGHELSLIHI